MEIVVRLFAQQRQALGWRERRLVLPEGATVGVAWTALVGEYPELGAASSFVRFARNAVYADEREALADGDELAVIPPVAGGAEPSRRIELRAEPIGDGLVAELRRTVPTAADGALVVFVGQTRETPGTPAPGQEGDAARFAGGHVLELEYEAFDEMALRVLDAIAAEILERYGVERLAIVHRTGEVPVGEASVVIAAAAAHRAAAFDACRYAIEELKARAPIWKSERFSDGRVWIGAPARSGPERGPERAAPAPHEDDR